MSECVVCGVEHDPDAGIVTGKPNEGDDRSCNICLQDHIREHTVLSRRESEVAALKLLGYRHERIAELLQTWRGEDKPTKSTVDEYSSRMNDKIEKAAATVNTFERFL
jgi:Holliday junction resolvasome RuvABC DNA-binding subunit